MLYMKYFMGIIRSILLVAVTNLNSSTCIQLFIPVILGNFQQMMLSSNYCHEKTHRDNVPDYCTGMTTILCISMSC